jgi:tetratricopeptide (TPR) repeat protein
MKCAQRVRSGFVLLVATFISSLGYGQSIADPSHATDLAKELQSRMLAVERARQSGDPDQITQTSGRVVSIALSEMADLRSLEGALPTAAVLHKRALEFEDVPSTRLRLAVVCTRAGAIDEALQQTEVILSANPDNAAAWNLEGKLWMMKKEYRRAADSLERSLSLQSDLEVAYTLATARLNLREKEQAAAVFKKMELSSGNPASMKIMEARAYDQTGFSEDAEREYKAAIALDPVKTRGHYFLGLFYLIKNSWEPNAAARQEFLDEVAVNPKDFFGNYFLGYVYSVEKSYQESDKYLKVAADAKPAWPEPYLYMGLNAYGAGSDRDAEVFLRKAIQLTGQDEARNNYQIRRAYFTLGRILIRSGNKDEGTKLIQKSREMETKLVVDARQEILSAREIAAETGAPGGDQPTVSNVPLPVVTNPAAPLESVTHDLSTLSPAEKKQAADAEVQLRKILGDSFNDIGAAKARLHSYDLALAFFHEAERWQPDTPGVMRNIGLAAFLSGQYGESARALKIVIANEPADQRSQSMLAMSLFSIKDYPAAVKVFDKVQDAAMADPRMTYGWAASLARTNNRQLASSILEKFIAQPLATDMLVRACQLYEEMGDKTNSKTCFEKAKSQDASVKLPD